MNDEAGCKYCLIFLRKILINQVNEMKRKANGTQQPRLLNGRRGPSTQQRCVMFVWQINQRFLNELR